MGLDLAVLGPLRVRADSVVEIERPSHRRLLSILALDSGRRIGTEVLIDRYWGEASPATAKAALQTHVSALRKLLGRKAIMTEGYGYRLDLNGGTLDSEEFLRLASAAKRGADGGDWEAALSADESAVALWRGRPFPELEDDDFARPHIARLEELRLELFELRAQALLAMGRDSEALPDLEALVVEHPLRERLWEHLMTARYRLGRHAEALRAYREVEEHLAEMGLAPGESLRRLEEKILLHDQGLTQPRHNLPVELSRFIGREEELEAATELLVEHRLVTLTGAGGSGKTRLGSRIALEALESYTDGVWYVELAALQDPDLIRTELTRVMGLQAPSEDALGFLARAIGSDTALILLDNCEHLLEGASAVARFVLEAAPGVKILATSREALRVPGEAVYEVPGMAFPVDDVREPHRALEYDAIRLFAERAALVRPSFSLDVSNVAPVVRICRSLDGMPLAIELAAARAASLAPDVIADRLDDRFRLLTGGPTTAPPRQQTLEATIAWSYQLLSPHEQRVLDRLSVFRGGFNLEMAESVCSGDGVDVADAVPIIANLTTKSLTAVYETAAGRRYRLFETVRDFARLRLEESGRQEDARDRHREWCLGFTSEVQRQWLGGGRDDLIMRIQLEADNLQEAFDWSRDREDPSGVGHLPDALEMHWTTLGHFSRSIDSLESALEASEDIERTAYLRVRYASLLFSINDSIGAIAQARMAYQLTNGAEPSPEKAFVIAALAHLHMMLVDEDPEPALPLARESLAVSLELGDSYSEVISRRTLANALSWNGHPDQGIEEMERALDIARETGNSARIFDIYYWFLHVLFLDPVARRERPRQLLEEMLEQFPEDDERWVASFASGWGPWVFCQMGELERAGAAMDRFGAHHLEQWDLLTHRILRGVVRWMQGRLGEARQDLLDMENEGLNPRWYHDYYPLLVDVLADLGRLEEARESAEAYLDTDVHPTEAAKKVGALNPLVRAEIDRALITAETREDGIRRAREAITTIQDIISEFPPPTEGSISMETPRTHLAFARAELSRATGPDPALWRKAVERADYLYFRLYARLRLAEALLETGEADEGAAKLNEVDAEAYRIGAALIRQRADEVAARFDVELN